MAGDVLTNEEWAFLRPFVVERGPKRGRPPADHRRVLEAVFWVAGTGSPWRDLPGEFGRWASVYKQYLRWTRSGLWDTLLSVLGEGGPMPDTLRKDGAAVMLLHHAPAPAREGLVRRLRMARALALRPRSACGRRRPMPASAAAARSGEDRAARPSLLPEEG